MRATKSHLHAGERERGQRDMPPPLHGVLREGNIAARREDRPANRHQPDQHEAEPELGNRKPEQCECHDSLIGGASMAHRCERPGRDADQDREDEGERGKRECDGQPLEDRFGHAAIEQQRRPRSPCNSAHVPFAHAQEEGSVETQLAAHAIQRLVRRAGIEKDRGRISRDQPEQSERDERNEEQHRNGGRHRRTTKRPMSALTAGGVGRRAMSAAQPARRPLQQSSHTPHMRGMRYGLKFLSLEDATWKSP